MRVQIDGESVTLGRPEGYCIHKMGDRLMVHGPTGTRTALVARQGDQTLISYQGRVFALSPDRPVTAKAVFASGELRAQMPGSIAEIAVEEGQKVMQGDKLAVLEAMKTLHAVFAPFDGTVRSVRASKGQQVVEGQVIVVVDPEDA